MEYGLKSSDLPKKKVIKRISNDSSILCDYRKNFYGIWHIPLKAKQKTKTMIITSNDVIMFVIDGSVTLFEYNGVDNYRKIDIPTKKSYKIRFGFYCPLSLPIVIGRQPAL